MLSPEALRRHLLRGVPDEVFQEIEREGWEPTVTAGNHIRWQHPTGAFTFSACTPSDWRAWKNNLAKFRRALRVGHRR